MNFDRRPYFYRLEGKTPVACTTDEYCALMQEKDARLVKRTVFPLTKIMVSTVFLSIDHAFMHGPPILFETMIFPDLGEEYQVRYRTWDEAVAGHGKACQYVRRRLFIYLVRSIVIRPVKVAGLYLKEKLKCGLKYLGRS